MLLVVVLGWARDYLPFGGGVNPSFLHNYEERGRPNQRYLWWGRHHFNVSGELPNSFFGHEKKAANQMVRRLALLI
jgi:hypothetical protein